ncbi:hypothetical protein ACFLXC_05630 [Chloroflexota bacterium]
MANTPYIKRQNKDGTTDKSGNKAPVVPPTRIPVVPPTRKK